MTDPDKMQLMMVLAELGYDDAFVFNVLLEVEKGNPMGRAIYNVTKATWDMLK